MYNSIMPTTTNYLQQYIEQQIYYNFQHDMPIKQEEQEMGDEQGLLLTCSYYPPFNNNINNTPTTTSMSLQSSCDEYSTTTTSSSPDMMTFQYGIDQLNSCDLSYSPSLSSPIQEDNHSLFDFYPFMQPQQQQEELQHVNTIIKQEESASHSLSSVSPSLSHSVLENRPYPCHLCKRAFARKHDLQRHIRVHTGDKPYSCACCKKAFARTDALKRHLRIEDQCRSSKEVLAMKNINGRRRKVNNNKNC